MDTHMDRIARRLGLVGENAPYGEVQRALTDFIPSERRERAAGLLWLFAKLTCRARNPKCGDCFFAHLCERGPEKGRRWNH